MSKKKEHKYGMIETIIPLLYICSPYDIAGVSLSVVLMLIGSFYMLLKGRRLIAYKPVLILFTFMFLHDFIKMAVVPINVGLWLERIVYVTFLFSITSRVNYDKLFYSWSFFGFFAVIGLLYQSIQVYVLHTPVRMIHIFPFLHSASENYELAYLRPHSFFLEPASYVVWIIPLLCMLLDRGKMIPAMIVTISVLLSTSSTGVVMVAVIWGCYAFAIKGGTRKYVRRRLAIAGILLVFGIFLNIDIFSLGINKLLNISIESTTNSVRLTLGYRLWWAAPLLYKVLGIPYANVEAYLRDGGIDLSKYYLTLNTSYLGYVNGIGNCMLMYGIFGLLFYIRMFWKLFFDIDKRLRIYFVACVISIFGQSVFWNTIFVMQFAIMLGCSTKTEKSSIRFVFGGKIARRRFGRMYK